ncbi:4-hydroxythreonine-4-phosphate dehydrogenase PdxA [Thermovenabulum gondwanense]|uniref:4-hydroxythreonine-4-phosphate dehydrogenase 2 n=1 Tax=Thermovenabulum gondwanense TaxID=520767 RepID=A0A162M5B7_9FIRM|nr:4-hydroxythreonine-4-phosphate dehydrogenase PdxA [Thermovenabulum gondwanense]KYO64107.1 4-hydroxythreonine-4-phosphate dehydrogenase 2 [Thermovenabulum gondwanense]
MANKPIIGITMGDPAGIGPEIVVKALSNKEIYKKVNPLVIGSKNIIEKAIEITKIKMDIIEIKEDEMNTWREKDFYFGKLYILDLNNIRGDIPFGKISAEAGKAAFEYIKKSIELAMEGLIDGVATAPINKEAIRAAGINFIGHTEIFAELTKSEDVLTMFQVDKLRIFFLTRHVSLIKACSMVTMNNIYKTLIACDKALKNLGLINATIAVAALNPHGGERGLFGTEEEREIIPAIKKAREEGIRVEGPVPADSVFYWARLGCYDAVLSLYHDQGHIAAKTLDFERTVSVTTGLPFIRTSVDHGTAFDIAGKGIASSVSMEEAIKVAGEYAKFFTSPSLRFD